ncbi:MAG: SAM-dependent methyltransferase [Pseudonocardia sp.]|nr:SAM-dependent methyltransferase [Pseudonocardia sp.]
MLADDHNVIVIQADINDVESIFTNPDLQAVLDLDRPFAIIASSILHHLDDGQARAAAAGLRAAMSPGSYFMAAILLDDDEDRAKELEQAFLSGGLGTGRFRSWAEFNEFFEGLELVEPGLVYADEWRPDAQTPASSPVQTLYAVGIAH